MGETPLFISCILLSALIVSSIAVAQQRKRPCTAIIESGGKEYSVSSDGIGRNTTPKWKNSCTAFQGHIHTVNADCPCCPSSVVEFRNDRKISKVDLVAFILLLFIVDMFIFSFTF